MLVEFEPSIGVKGSDTNMGQGSLGLSPVPTVGNVTGFTNRRLSSNIKTMFTTQALVNQFSQT